MLEFSWSLKFASELFDQQMLLSFLCPMVTILGSASAKFLASLVELIRLVESNWQITGVSYCGVGSKEVTQRIVDI